MDFRGRCRNYSVSKGFSRHLSFFFFLQTCYISKNTRLISLKFEKLNMNAFTKTCAIPSLPGSHNEGPQLTDTVLTSCKTLPELQAASLSCADRARAVHSVCSAAANHELFLRSSCYHDPALRGR
jgi:hypothetical protein